MSTLLFIYALRFAFEVFKSRRKCFFLQYMSFLCVYGVRCEQKQHFMTIHSDWVSVPRAISLFDKKHKLAPNGLWSLQTAHQKAPSRITKAIFLAI
jgi:hypothetical protein